MIKYRQKIQGAKEVILVGKNFRNSDNELSRFISSCSQAQIKTLKIIDPKIRDDTFIDYHCELFNAEYVGGWESLIDFYKSSSSI